MKVVNVIFAACLALLVALPLCCCSVNAGKAKAAVGCCQTEQETGGTENETKICACGSHDAKDITEAMRLPDAGAREIIILAFQLIFAPVPPDIMAVFPAGPRITDDPHDSVFARYSRWMI